MLVIFDIMHHQSLFMFSGSLQRAWFNKDAASRLAQWDQDLKSFTSLITVEFEKKNDFFGNMHLKRQKITAVDRICVSKGLVHLSTPYQSKQTQIHMFHACQSRGVFGYVSLKSSPSAAEFTAHEAVQSTHTTEGDHQCLRKLPLWQRVSMNEVISSTESRMVTSLFSSVW